MFYRIEIGYKSKVVNMDKTKKMIIFEVESNNLSDSKFEINEKFKNTNLVLLRIMNPMKEYNGVHNNDNSLNIYFNFIKKLEKTTKENKIRETIDKKKNSIKKYVFSLLIIATSFFMAIYFNDKINHQIISLLIYGIIVLSAIIISAISITKIKKYNTIIEKIKIY